MTEYSLYLESGPKMRKTMIHVLDLLGCVIRGPTTEDALATTPKGIHTYLSFLRTLGEPVDPQAPFTTRIAIHIMEGVWLGEGDPTPGFAPDFLPLSSDDLAIGIIRLSGLHMSLLELISGLSREQLLVAPLNGHRPLFNVLEHAISSEYTYLRMQVGPIKELSSALKAIKPGCVEMAMRLAKLSLGGGRTTG